MDKSNLATGSVSAWPKGLVLLAVAALAAAVLWGAGAVVVQADPPAFDSLDTTIVAVAGTSITLDTPAAAADGDLLVAVVCVRDSKTITPDPDWTIIDGSAVTDVTAGVWYQTFETGTTDASYNFTWTGNAQATGAMLLFTDVDTSDPIGDTAGTSGNTNTPTSPAMITTVDDALVLRLFCAEGSGLALQNHPPAGHAAIFAIESSNSANATTSGGVYETEENFNTDVGTAVFDLAGGSATDWHAFSIEIKPFVPPTPTPTATNTATATATKTTGAGTPTNTPVATATKTTDAGTPVGTATQTTGGPAAATQTAQAGPPHLGAIIGAGRQATATPRPAQQQPSTAGAISPPRTGDAGLVEQSRGLDAVVLVLLTISVTSAGLALSRKLSR
jgi:hypothetical protein